MRMDFMVAAGMALTAFVGGVCAQVLDQQLSVPHERYIAMRRAQWSASPQEYKENQLHIDEIMQDSSLDKGLNWRAWIRVLPWILWQIGALASIIFLALYTVLFLRFTGHYSFWRLCVLGMCCLCFLSVVIYGFYERYGPYVISIEPDVILHVHPHEQSPSVYCCAYCEEGSILGQNGPWWLIKTRTSKGWVRKEHTRKYTWDLWE